MRVSLAALEPDRKQLVRSGRDVSKPFGFKRSVITEERTPGSIVNVNLDAVLLDIVVIPFAHIGDSGKEQRKGKADEPFVESLCARPEPHATRFIHGHVDVDGEMLMSSEIIHDPSTFLAVDHVSIEAPRCFCFEAANPGHSLAAEWIEER